MLFMLFILVKCTFLLLFDIYIYTHTENKDYFFIVKAEYSLMVDERNMIVVLL